MPPCDFQIVERLTVDEAADIYRALYARGRHGTSPKTDDYRWMFERGNRWVRAVVPLDNLDFQTEDESGVNRIERAQRYGERRTPFSPGVASYGPRLQRRRAGKAYVQDGNHRTLAAHLRGDCSIEMLMPEPEYHALIEDAEWRDSRRAHGLSEPVQLPRASYWRSGRTALDALNNPEDLPGAGQRDTGWIQTAITRAIEAGAEPPLTYIGAGAEGVVFCDRDNAYKVTRHDKRSLEDEAEWLMTAAHVPEIARHIPRPIRYDAENRVIVRRCVSGTRGTWGGSKKIHDLWDQVAPYMSAAGWTMPELKEDSVIFDDEGVPVIVDAGMAMRIGNRLLAYVADILDGKREPLAYEDPSTLAFYVRREFGQKEPLDEEWAKELLSRLYALGARE